MNIALSNRVKDVFQRFVEVSLEKIVKDAKECVGNAGDEERATDYRVGDWKMEVCTQAAYHADDCPNEEDDLSYGSKCDVCDSTPHSLTITLYHKRKPIACEIMEVSTITFENVSTWIQALPTAWELCRCQTVLRDSPSPKHGTCKQCYIRGYIRSEEEGGNCCICQENDDRWVKFKCGHAIHWHCYLLMTDHGMKNMRCPLCREAISGNVVDPYDV